MRQFDVNEVGDFNLQFLEGYIKLYSTLKGWMYLSYLIKFSI